MQNPSTDPGSSEAPSPHVPFVPAHEAPRELTWPSLLVGALLGIIFGASSVYLVLKTGITVSASIPVAVMSITLFRGCSRLFGLRPATILENNIVQTAGSAGESIAFGAGVTMPALLLLGLDMSFERVMVVCILGGLLGILMMIPLRRTFIVESHGKLVYPEGTACAEVLIVGERGGSTAKTVFTGFGIGFVFQFLREAMHGFAEAISWPVRALRGAVVGSEVGPHLLGVGYIIGPRIASIMVAGGILAYLVILPTIVFFASNQSAPLGTASKLIKEMSPGEIRSAYILYIGAGAVATGGLISMLKVLPTIFRALAGSLKDLGSRRSAGGGAGAVPRTEKDLPMSVVFGGCILLVLGIVLAPTIGIELLPPLSVAPWDAVLGALLIVFCGFLFVTVSSRLTGEIGSSSNPISGMTVATLLITCLVFLALGRVSAQDKLAALSIAGIVCIAASNGGTTSQDLKTGFLVGGTPRAQQLAILAGAFSSALVIGSVLIALNDAGTIYSKKHAPSGVKIDVASLSGKREAIRGPGHEVDTREYLVWQAQPGNPEQVAPGKYLVNDDGSVAYLVDPAITGKLSERDDGTRVTAKFEAPKTQLMYLIINGVLERKLPWDLVLLGVLIALTLELAGVASLPFAVGIYLPLEASAPIFLGGLLRLGVDRYWRARTGQGEPDSGPGVLLASGYIAGGTIAGVVAAFLSFSDRAQSHLNCHNDDAVGLAVVLFIGLMILQLLVGIGVLFRGPTPGQLSSVEEGK